MVETKTKDNVFVRIEVTIQQQPRPGCIKDAIYRLHSPNAQIDSFVNDTVRSEVPKMLLDDVFSDKDRIANQVKEHITHHMNMFGWDILSSLVTEVDPDQHVKNAMNAIETAKRDQYSLETDAEANKNVAIKRAQAEAESKALQGMGIARQRAAIVQGLKDSIGMGGGDADAAKVSELLLITQYFDTLEKLATGQGKIIFTDGTNSMRDAVMQATA
jgi:regulator of protease activity HflC (stomatin/prohibitin superfamily)